MEMGWGVIVMGCRSFDEAYKAASGPASAPAQLCVFGHVAVLEEEEEEEEVPASPLACDQSPFAVGDPSKACGSPEHRWTKVPAGDMR